MKSIYSWIHGSQYSYDSDESIDEVKKDIDYAVDYNVHAPVAFYDHDTAILYVCKGHHKAMKADKLKEYFNIPPHKEVIEFELWETEATND